MPTPLTCGDEDLISRIDSHHSHVGKKVILACFRSCVLHLLRVSMGDTSAVGLTRISELNVETGQAVRGVAIPVGGKQCSPLPSPLITWFWTVVAERESAL